MNGLKSWFRRTPKWKKEIEGLFSWIRRRQWPIVAHDTSLQDAPTRSRNRQPPPHQQTRYLTCSVFEQRWIRGACPQRSRGKQCHKLQRMSSPTGDTPTRPHGYTTAATSAVSNISATVRDSGATQRAHLTHYRLSKKLSSASNSGKSRKRLWN